MSNANFLALLAAAILPTAANAQATKFDLVCSGTERTMGTGEAKPDARRYTIDVAAKRWCRTDECSGAGAIKAATPDLITLTESEPGAGLEHRHQISRQDGTYSETIFMQITGTGSRATGTCKPAPFSGFPRPKF